MGDVVENKKDVVSGITGLFTTPADINIPKGTDIISATLTLWGAATFYMALYTIAAVILIGYVGIPRVLPQVTNFFMPQEYKNAVKSGKFDKKVSGDH